MLLRTLLLIAVSAPLAACKPPSPEAPTDLSDLVRYLFAEWHNEDPQPMQDGLANLDAFMRDIDMDTAAVDRSWVPEPLTVEDVSAVTWPERDLEATIPLTVAGAGPWAVTDHARLQTEADQLPAEPTAVRYDRTVTNVDDPSCFWDGSCGLIETDNDVRRDNLVMSVDFAMRKDFRWVNIGSGEDARRAVVGRSWLEDSFVGDEGNTHLWMSFAVDVWMELPDGSTQRVQSLWSESETIDVEEDIVRNLLRGSIDDVFDAGDAAIEELYYSE